MKPKTILVVGLVIAIAGAVVRLLFVERESAQQSAGHSVKPKRSAASAPGVNQTRPTAPRVAPSRPERSSREPIVTAGNTQKPLLVGPDHQMNVTTQANAGTPLAATQSAPGPDLSNPAVKEKIGRMALSFVGVDADADEVWIWAINDASLSANARKNLIEDLNEDGFSDPKNPTVDELPLIESRIMLIEELAPDAMDDDNAAAFQEAYKDLVNMWLRLVRQ